MSIPEKPSNTDVFPAQHGYADISVKTQKYSDEPTPFKSKQNKASEFLADHSDKEHQKKYAKQAFCPHSARKTPKDP
ncbi:uncharacterized protein RJT20DRAFT_139163 [Scheffersomyces xylosifermentans]|uniref:uncharacterized protein n=1 Tax=Scheffersomyces xylosifermentans TaxID=1304137 RepID=UPI00315DEEF1